MIDEIRVISCGARSDRDGPVDGLRASLPDHAGAGRLGVARRLSWLAGEGTEITLLSAAATLAAVVLVWGWHAHRRLESLGLFAAALMLVGAGRFLVPETAETPMVVAGGLSIALAHVVNARLCQSCARCRTAAGAEPPQPSTSGVTQLPARPVTQPSLAPRGFMASATPAARPDN